MSASKLAHKTAVAQYTIRVCIRFKKVRDTIKECNRNKEPWGPYIHGVHRPHFPVPAIRVGVYIDENMVYVSDGHHLTRFYKEGEWFDVEADSHLH